MGRGGRLLPRFHWPPSRREVVVGVVAGSFLGGLTIVIPPSVEANLVAVVVLLAAMSFVRWRWGEAIDRWFRG